MKSDECKGQMWSINYERSENMGVAQYDIVPVGKLWSVQHDGKVNGEYSTKESAFEPAAVAASMAIEPAAVAASMAIKQGHEIRISVPSAEDSGAASKAI
jgi:hypothetical protein